MRMSQRHPFFHYAFPFFEVLADQHESQYGPIWGPSVHLLGRLVRGRPNLNAGGLFPVHQRGYSHSHPILLHISVQILIQGSGSLRNACLIKVSKYVHDEAKEMQVQRNSVMEKQRVRGRVKRKYTFLDPHLGKWPWVWAQLEIQGSIPILMVGVVGNAIKCQNFSKRKNSKYLLLWALETKKGSLSFEVGRRKGSKACLQRKEFYEVLFPVEDIIIIFCWETFGLVYSKDLI